MSGQIMVFPDSVEEFMESYKMVDTEHIYSNGTEYVPIFRMRQWFEHEVVHGEWIVLYDEDSPQDGIWKCSICDYIRLVDDITPTNYCPNCGADMRGEEDDKG